MMCVILGVGPICMRRTTLALVLALAALPLRADTFADLKTALGTLHGTASISAGVDVQVTRKSSGRFANQQFATSVAFDVTHDGNGLQLRFPPALIARMDAEAREHEADPNKPTPTRNAVSEIQANEVAGDLDFAEHLARLLRIAAVVSESRGVLGAKPVRILVLKLTPKLPKEATSIFNVKFTQDRLTVWVGDDNVPLAADRARKGTAGFLFLRGEMTDHQAWSFTRHGDRLVVSRYEGSFLGSGFGQKGEGKTVQTITVR